MSKILLKKINNILDIDKDKEYIDQTQQDISEYIELSTFANEDAINCLMQQNQLIHTFQPEYNEILDQLKQINNFQDLRDFLNDEIFNDLDLSIHPHQINLHVPKKASEQEIKQIELEKIILNEEDYLYHKNAIYEEVKQYLLSDLKPFNDLNKLAFKKFIETGKELLRLATHFIQGNINRHYINAPLFLYDVKLSIEQNKLIIQKTNNVILNEKLIIFLAKQLKVDYQQWNLDAIKTIDDFKKIFEPLLQYSIKDDDILNGAIYTNDVFRTLKCINTPIIGLFDVKPGKIKDDFIQIVKNNIDLFNQKMVHDFEYYTNLEFQNNALAQVNKPLNIYQKYAVRSAINENTLIYGPPGTGKSEIITTIIANLLINAKTTLVVSEKDAALKVIKERLNGLSKFAFYLKDIENENDFYDQIQSIAQHMGSFNQNSNDHNSEFNIFEQYQNHDRVKDYNQTIKKFRNILLEDIHFSLQKDSRNNDYRDYLLSINEVNRFIKNNNESVNEFWKEYQNKFVKLQSPTEFIAKVAEYNYFREHFELSEEEVNRLEQAKIEINKFFAQYDIDNKLINYEQLIKHVNTLNEFISNMLLIKDRDFMDAIANDYLLLSNNYEYFKAINELLLDFKDHQSILKFLIRNCVKHEKFLAKYLTTPKHLQSNLIARYYYKNEINTKNILFKSKRDQKFNDAFIKAIQLFSKIKIFKNNQYLFELIKLTPDILNSINVFFLVNQDLCKKQVIEYYTKQIINFDNRIMNQYYKYRINMIERELININVYRYEKIIGNKHIIERDLTYHIQRYLRDNYDFILNMDEAISQTYLKFIKWKLQQAPQALRDKTEQMFKIVNLEVKPKINDFILEFIDCLKIIFPIWISKPELVSFYVQNQAQVFDVGIFDEASQMFLEKAYPMLYRCKQYIIAGDDKQLKPERMCFNALDLDPDYRPLVKEIEFDYSESLLDRAKVSYWNSYMLRNHYRSKAKELIEFSNINFYDNKLLFSTINNNQLALPLEVINIKAKETKQTNNEQAKQVISKIKQNLNSFYKILVICFSFEQRQLIQQLLKKENNLEINRRIKQKQLIIGDISSVQGDEGDLVIISTVYSKESKNYGLITAPRGMNYLNVAITRAIEKLIILKSINHQDIKVDANDPFEDSMIFKTWIKYLDEKQKASNEISSISKQKLNISQFKQDVYNQLVKDERFFNKVQIIQNLLIGTTKIDLAFYTKSINDLDLVVILDDWKKNIDIQSWFEDIDHEEYLRSRNYEVLRIREQDWLVDKDKVINQIYSLLENKLVQQVSKTSRKNKKDVASKRHIKKQKKRNGT